MIGQNSGVDMCSRCIREGSLCIRISCARVSSDVRTLVVMSRIKRPRILRLMSVFYAVHDRLYVPVKNIWISIGSTFATTLVRSCFRDRFQSIQLRVVSGTLSIPGTVAVLSKTLPAIRLRGGTGVQAGLGNPGPWSDPA